ncbi:MAG: agmatinase [Cyanobacteria bacterium QH_8_48_120]|jgi:agmatinase|nr:MAG: agmatinase [Cyanobacteria bacterium QH_1_48_107]PSO53015.1 MAG: agmatinase [Cyanobacteria bacterium QH_10_48_56]PSO57735.1 MAG: agmatinase [Cyanobacteria bacterium QH_7_48_89]PSO61571.1 MAG: agmatinase [Cyanobacteria bacterium QH_6_48_35]PSO70129.1 MAG: agmatinase [Cyanobacteria bacterium QH_8_48_120]PSO74360.1 MAG: agmatinase [Cyanobacteria bacterium QH_3_48_40]PSO79969.1 MAG: agmatinase [Cyanobacteria bacterium QS_5_48_63]PSO85797.1 MAG: agmatinase [Cyanobacteria bacterium QH_9_48_
MTEQPEFQSPNANQNGYSSEANRALEQEAQLPMTGWQQEVSSGLELGLEAAESIGDRSISTFSRGELPHYAGINTFLKAPYLEDVRQVEKYDVAIMGVPHDSGTTYRPGTRFGPQGIRRISALYTPYNFEMSVDLREQISLCDVGDVFTIPGNNEKSFDQISKGIAHVFSSGAFPIILGGDHSIGFPTVRGICRHLGDKKVGIIHFDRHVDTQETDLDERMHTCPWFHANNIKNAPPQNLVQLGIGGWQVPRQGVKVCRERATNILTVTDITEMGLDAAVDFALERALDDTDCVYISFDIDCIDAGFVPGTGWPEPGGLLPREALYMLGKIVRSAPVCGLEVVEVSPPYDVSDMTALMATRVICDSMAHLVLSEQLPRQEKPAYIHPEAQPETTTDWV